MYKFKITDIGSKVASIVEWLVKINAQWDKKDGYIYVYDEITAKAFVYKIGYSCVYVPHTS